MPGGRTSVAIGQTSKWDDKGDALAAAWSHWRDKHRGDDDALTTAEVNEREQWPLSSAQRTRLVWADRTSYWGMDVSPDKADVNKRAARGRVTGL